MSKAKVGDLGFGYRVLGDSGWLGFGATARTPRISTAC